ncbi:AfsR/SARP family transcriptional regulator [Streptomyces enissocaesilis]|uniref:Bacterial transcriptional activator domain-containing protein n=1 Tax=Streptomyces enissocaesilis TaxID=332589 RepID=A0ABN3WTU0_9ACTN
MLATLVIAGERRLAAHEIHQVLWGTAPPVTVRAQVHTYVYAAGGIAQAAELFTDALGQWRGPALIGATEFLEASEAPRLEGLRMPVLEEKAAADPSLGPVRRVVEELAPCMPLFPFREGLRSLPMTALSQCGRQAEAITLYHEGRSVLAEHLTVDPGDELNSTFQSLLAGTLIARPTLPEGADTAVRPEAVSSREEAYTALPPDLVDLTGRHAELRRLREWLKPAPDGTGCAGPVVVTGLAGSGKTVLAVRAGYGIAPAYPDGTLFVRGRDTSGYRRPPADIAGDLLRGLGERVAPTAGSEERVWRLRTRLTQSRCLVILDDAADEAQVHALVPGSGRTQFLITGRPRFATLPRVRVVALGGLQLCEAMDLLNGITSGVGVSTDDAERLVRLCDGHPAAMRAVAAQLIAKPHWTPAYLADRLADPCRDTLGLLRAKVEPTAFSLLN